MTVQFGTKAETLARLETVVRRARVLPQLRADWASWSRDPEAVLAELATRDWLACPLIVRSSARGEDSAGESMAGRFASVINVRGKESVAAAIRKVFASYGDVTDAMEHVFIQPFLDDVSVSGVAFSCDPNSGAPYVVVNYDHSGDTSAVTSGSARQAETFYFWKHGTNPPAGFLADIVALLRELEQLLGCETLDIEFAVSKTKGLCLLQVRPLRVAAPALDAKRHGAILGQISDRISSASRPHPYLHGRRTVFGVMPDWNPAEIIGTRPRPLALSLYRRLVTDQIWAYQRSSYGYKNLRSFPLMVSFHGMPYVDVRVSFNSFVPADIQGKVADRLVDHYLKCLLERPALHDKVEFEIVFSCYTLDISERLGVLRDALGSDAVAILSDSLRRLTNRILHADHGLWRQDLVRIKELSVRRQQILDADMDTVTRIYWLLEDCKRWGTLPFAGLARAGFIAMQMLRSIVSTGVMDERQSAAFLTGLDTVTSHMMRDLSTLDRADFLARYGHLRPGTYDILSPRYDEDPDRYLGTMKGAPAESAGAPPPVEDFRLDAKQTKDLTESLRSHGLDTDAKDLFDFMRSAIRGREQAKFEFTRSLSDAISLLKDLGRSHDLSADDMSYADIAVIEELYVSSADPGEALRRSIAVGREQYAETRTIILPPLISEPDEVWGFHLPPNEPNFITQGTAEGPVRACDGPAGSLDGAIVFIANADPGFDWIFTKGIAGLVTAYGGVNSHMAIRAQERGLPAVIGAGEAMFQTWQAAKVLRLDCLNRRVEVLRA